MPHEGVEIAAEGPRAEEVQTEDRSAGLLALLASPDTALGSIPLPRIGADPPKEFRAFTWGTNPTTKGTLRLTPQGAQQVMDRYRARGVAKVFDYYHSTFNPAVAPDERKAAGHFRLELRSDGLWFADIQWTPRAAQGIRDGEWPYISPAVLHSKDGEIVELKNAALVTDPGTIGAAPTILSGSSLGAGAPPSTSHKGNLSMSDKKRAVLEAYTALETAMRRCQALADTDGTEKDLGNALTGHLAPLMDRTRSAMKSSGYLEDAVMSARAAGARDKLMSTLEAELSESDPERLHGKFLARLLLSNAPAAPAEGTRLSAEDEQLLKRLLLDGYRERYPTTKRASLEALPLPGLCTFLSAASDIVPMAPAPREAAPLAPTTANTEAALKDAPKPAGGRGGKPTTLAECSAQQRIQVETHLESARLFQSSSFDEKTELQFALAALSDTDEAPRDNRIRHLPYGMDPSTGRPTTLTESV